MDEAADYYDYSVVMTAGPPAGYLSSASDASSSASSITRRKVMRCRRHREREPENSERTTDLYQNRHLGPQNQSGSKVPVLVASVDQSTGRYMGHFEETTLSRDGQATNTPGVTISNGDNGQATVSMANINGNVDSYKRSDEKKSKAHVTDVQIRYRKDKEGYDEDIDNSDDTEDTLNDSEREHHEILAYTKGRADDNHESNGERYIEIEIPSKRIARHRATVENLRGRPDVIRATSARDLVRSQERLVDMLQEMRSDIARMDREATRIREDVVKSNQLFDIVVRMKYAHHLPLSNAGFNMAYSMPRSTIPQQLACTSKPINMQYLNKLLNTGALVSRRNSISSAGSASCNANTDDVFRHDFNTHDMGNSSLPYKSAYCGKDHRGIESDVESSTSTRSVHDWTAGEFSSSATSRDSDSATSEETESETESVTSCSDVSNESWPVGPATGGNRRPSYFYPAQTVASRAQSQSDEVDL